MRKVLIIFILSVGTLFVGFAQTIKDTTIKAPVFTISYAGQAPMGDLSERFGINSNLGFSAGYKTASNWLFELQGSFLFSQNIKEDSLLAPLAGSDGFIVNSEGNHAFIELYQRGFTGSFDVGRIFPWFGPNLNSGMVFKAGIGFMQHKIRIQNENNLVPLLTGESIKFWDRYTLGVMTKQYIGYHHMANTNLANFTFGIELMQGFTRGMRDYQIDLEGPYRDNRFDMLFGIRFGWIVPVYRRAPNMSS